MFEATIAILESHLSDEGYQEEIAEAISMLGKGTTENITTTGIIKSGYIDLADNEIKIKFEKTGNRWNFKDLFTMVGQTWSVILKKELDI